jgi:hypothetical protein
MGLWNVEAFTLSRLVSHKSKTFFDMLFRKYISQCLRTYCKFQQAMWLFRLFLSQCSLIGMCKELRFWRMTSSGMLRRVALVRTDVTEELSASFIRVTRICELGTTLAGTSNRRTLLSVRRLLVTASYVPLLPHSCHMSRPPLPPRLYNYNYTWRRVQILTLLGMLLSRNNITLSLMALVAKLGAH